MARVDRIEPRSPFEIAVLIIAFSALALLSFSCNRPVTSSPARLTLPPESEFDIYVDATKSLDEEARREAVENVYRQIRSIVETWNVINLRIFEFTADGFLPKPKLTVEIPALETPSSEQSRVPDIRADIREAKFEEARERLLQKHRLEVSEALARLSPKIMLPNSGAVETCTDLAGLLSRVAQTAAERPNLVIIVTDGLNDCDTPFISVPPPPTGVLLVIVLVPDRIELRKSAKTALTGAEAYDKRRTEVSKKVPWAIIVPHFYLDFKSAFERAKSATSADKP